MRPAAESLASITDQLTRGEKVKLPKDANAIEARNKIGKKARVLKDNAATLKGVEWKSVKFLKVPMDTKGHPKWDEAKEVRVTKGDQIKEKIAKKKAEAKQKKEAQKPAQPEMAGKEVAKETVKPVSESVGARKATRAGLARVGEAKQRLREIINNEDIVGAQRVDMIEDGNRLIAFLQAKANTNKPMSEGVENGDRVAYTGEDAPEGFRSFIYLEGAKAGKEGVSRTLEQRTVDSERAKQVQVTGSGVKAKDYVFKPSPAPAEPQKPTAKVAETGKAAELIPARVNPKELTREVKSDTGYVYHATNEERLEDITRSRKLIPHKPSYGTDQNAWPDKGTEERSYFSRKADIVWQFSPEDGKPVLIRTKDTPDLLTEVTGDVFSRKPISSDKLEYLGEDNQWYPISAAPVTKGAGNTVILGDQLRDARKEVKQAEVEYNKAVSEHTSGSAEAAWRGRELNRLSAFRDSLETQLYDAEHPSEKPVTPRVQEATKEPQTRPVAAVRPAAESLAPITDQLTRGEKIKFPKDANAIQARNKAGKKSQVLKEDADTLKGIEWKSVKFLKVPMDTKGHPKWDEAKEVKVTKGEQIKEKIAKKKESRNEQTDINALRQGSESISDVQTERQAFEQLKEKVDRGTFGNDTRAIASIITGAKLNPEWAKSDNAIRYKRELLSKGWRVVYLDNPSTRIGGAVVRDERLIIVADMNLAKHEAFHALVTDGDAEALQQVDDARKYATDNPDVFEYVRNLIAKGFQTKPEQVIPEMIYEDIAAYRYQGKGKIHDIMLKKEAKHALQESVAGTVLQRPQEGTGETGRKRGRVEPSEQGAETAIPEKPKEVGQKRTGLEEPVAKQEIKTPIETKPETPGLVIQQEKPVATSSTSILRDQIRDAKKETKQGLVIERKDAVKVESTSKGKTISVPEKDKPGISGKEQKKYLLAEIDKAIETAPEGEVEARDVPSKWEIESGNYDASRPAKNKAIFERNKEKYGMVTIEVPGDGTFELLNNKSALSDFRERAKSFPTTPSKAESFGMHPKKPSAIVAVAKERPKNVDDLKKIVQTFASRDPTREVINETHLDSKTHSLIGTDGRRLFIVKDVQGATTKHAAGEFPNWKEPIPDYKRDPDFQKVSIKDTEKLIRQLRQAEQVAPEMAPFVALYLDKKGDIQLRSMQEESGSYQSGDLKDVQGLTYLNPTFLDEGLTAMRKLGNAGVTLYVKNDGSRVPIVIEGNSALYVQMPIAVEGTDLPGVPGQKRIPGKAERLSKIDSDNAGKRYGSLLGKVADAREQFPEEADSIAKELDYYRKEPKTYGDLDTYNSRLNAIEQKLKNLEQPESGSGDQTPAVPEPAKTLIEAKPKKAKILTKQIPEERLDAFKRRLDNDEEKNIWASARVAGESFRGAGGDEANRLIERARSAGYEVTYFVGGDVTGVTDVSPEASDIFIRVNDRSDEDILQSLRHEIFHVLAVNQDEDVLKLIARVDQNSEEYKTFSAEYMANEFNSSIASAYVAEQKPTNEDEYSSHLRAYITEEYAAEYFKGKEAFSRGFTAPNTVKILAKKIRRYEPVPSDEPGGKETAKERSARLSELRKEARAAGKAYKLLGEPGSMAATEKEKVRLFKQNMRQLQVEAKAARRAHTKGWFADYLAKKKAIEAALAAEIHGKAEGRAEGRIEALDVARKQLRSAIETVKKGVAQPDTTLAGDEALVKAQTNLVAAIGRLRNAVAMRTGHESLDTLRDFWKEVKPLLPLSERGKVVPAMLTIRTKADYWHAQNRLEAVIATWQKRSLIAGIKRLAKRIRKSKAIAVEYKTQINKVLDAFLLRKPSARSLARLQLLQEQLGEAANTKSDAEIPLRVAQQLRMLYRLDKGEVRPISDLNVNELVSVFTEMKTLFNAGIWKKETRDALDAFRKEEDLARLTEQGVANVDGLEGEKQTSPLDPAFYSFKGKISDAIRGGMDNSRHGMLWALTPDRFFDYLDKAQYYSGVMMDIFRHRPNRAYAVFMDEYAKLKDEFEKVLKEAKLKDRDIAQLGVYAAGQQRTGRERLLNRGDMTEAQIDAIVLTPEQERVYKLARKQNEELKPFIKEFMARVHNLPFKEEEDYFPFMTDWDVTDHFLGNFSMKAETGEVYRKNPEAGFTKERRGAGKQKIRIDFANVHARHLRDALYLIHMGETTKYMGELARSEEFGNLVGSYGQKIVLEYVDSMARGSAVKDKANFLLRSLEKLSRNIGVFVIGGRVSSTLVQFTSLLNGAAMLGADGTLRMESALSDIATDKKAREFVWKFSEVKHRMFDDPTFLDLGNKGTLHDIRKAAFWLLQRNDGITAASVALAAYRKYAEEHGIQVDYDNPVAEGVEYAQNKVRLTQSSSRFKDQPLFLMRGKLGGATVTRLLMQLKSFQYSADFLLSAYDAVYYAGKRGEWGQAFNIMVMLMLASMLGLGIRRGTDELVRELLDKKRKKKQDPFYIAALKDRVMNIPVVGEIMGFLMYDRNPVPIFDWAGETLEDLKYAREGKRKKTRFKHGARAFVEGVGGALGLPASEILRTVKILTE